MRGRCQVARPCSSWRRNARVKWSNFGKKVGSDTNKLNTVIEKRYYTSVGGLMFEQSLLLSMSIYLPFPRHFVRIHNDFWDYLSSEMSCKVWQNEAYTQKKNIKRAIPFYENKWTKIIIQRNQQRPHLNKIQCRVCETKHLLCLCQTCLEKSWGHMHDKSKYI